MPAIWFLEDGENDLIDGLSDLVFVVNAIVVQVNEEVHQHPS